LCRLFALIVGVLLCVMGAYALPASFASEAALEKQIETELAAGRLEDALNLGRQGVTQYPSSPVLYRMLGTIEFKAGKNDHARADLRHAIALDPSFPETYEELGQVEFGSGDFRDAANSLSAYVGLDPLNLKSRVLLGRAYYNLNQARLAENQFQQVLRSAPGQPMIHYYLGLTEEKEGKALEALGQFQQEIRTNPRFYAPYFLAGDLEWKAGNAHRAEQFLLRGMALHPGDDRAHFDLGRVFLMENRPAKAVAQLKLALEEKPRATDAHCALAQAYAKMDAIEDAQLEFHACMQMGTLQPARSAANN
jgi:predicted Zn-dependent protease